MKALTLWQPWAWAVGRGHKRVENRSWWPPDGIIMERIAIHAGKTYDSKGYELAAPGWAPSPGDEARIHGAIIATVVVDSASDSPCDMPEQHQQWFFGPVGWALGGALWLRQPIYCRGYQGLWTVPAEIEAEITRQLA